MLAVVGLVIGGIWVAAATVSENRTANTIVQGSLSYFQAASNLVRNNGGVAMLNANVVIKAGLMPKDLIIDENAQTFGYGKVSIGLANSIIGGYQYEGTGLVYLMPLNQSGLCRKILIRLTNLAWRQVVSIVGGASATTYPFGGSGSTPTILTGPISPGNAGLSICETDFFGMGRSFVTVVYGIHR